METRTEAQNRRLYALLQKLGIAHDAEARRLMALSFSGNRTEHTAELSVAEADALIRHLQDAADTHEKELKRLRRRLQFVMADSRYPKFWYKGQRGKPDFANIDSYCHAHWGKHLNDMSVRELSQYIAIAVRWK